jgi:hypothetical protein
LAIEIERSFDAFPPGHFFLEAEGALNGRDIST